MGKHFIDTETTGLSVWQGDRPYMVGDLYERNDGKGTVSLYERTVDPKTRGVDWTKGDDYDQLADMLGSTKTKGFFNAGFDLDMIETGIGLPVRGRIEDVSFMARVCNTAEPKGGYKLKRLAWKYFRFPDDDQEALASATQQARRIVKKNYPSWKTHEEVEADYWLMQQAKKLGIDFDAALLDNYLTGDCFRTSLLFQMYEEVMTREPLYRETYELELELLPLIRRMEARGMTLSRKAVLREKVKLEEKLEACYRRIKKQAGPDFNVYSPDKMRTYLFSPESKGGLGLKTTRRTKKGNVSTDWKTLRPFFNVPFVWDVVQFKVWDKGVSTFFDRFLYLMILQEDGTYKVHPSLNQCGTRTGRFSSNFQQIPKPGMSVKGTEVIPARRPFGPKQGRVWPLADYEQMELRVLAELAEIDSVLDSIANGRDPYSDLANRIWGGRGNRGKSLPVMADQLGFRSQRPSSDELAEAWEWLGWNSAYSRINGAKSPEALGAAQEWLERFDWDIAKAEKALGQTTRRQIAKFTTLAKQYGGGPDSLSDLLFCSWDDAEDFIRDYDSRVPEIKRYLKKESKLAEKTGYVETLWGRKLRVDEARLYASVNYKVQGSCADLVKRAMLKTDRYLGMTGFDGHIMMQYHDELLFDFDRRHVTRPIIKRLTKIMEDTEGRLKVPMTVEFKVCTKTWETKEDIESLWA